MAPEAGVTVREACAELLPRVAVITALVVDVTVCVLTVKVALVARAAMVTLDGTVATEVFPLDRVTTAPVAPPYVAEIVTLVLVDTLWVLTVKVALVLPASEVSHERSVRVTPRGRITRISSR